MSHVRLFLTPLEEDEEVLLDLSEKEFESFVSVNSTSLAASKRILPLINEDKCVAFLHSAVSRCNVDIARECLRYVSVERLEREDFCGAFWVATIGGSIDAMEFCIDYLHVNINEVGRYSYLTAATAFGKLDAVRYLFRRGADPNLSLDGKTTVFGAIVSFNNAAVFDEFVVAGADLSTRVENSSLFATSARNNTWRIAARLFNLGLASNDMHTVYHTASFYKFLVLTNEEVNKGDIADGKGELNRFLFAYLQEHQGDYVLARELLALIENVSNRAPNSTLKDYLESMAA